MSRTITEYKVFIASPSDLGTERGIVRQVCGELNQSPLVAARGMQLAVVGWEDVVPSAGRPQDTINRLQADCDIFICMLFRTYGTPTGSSGSGTEEEFLNAYDSWKALGKPRILFYFKELRKLSLADMKNPQILKVMELKERIQKDELLLYGEFESEDNFREQLRGHLEQVIPKLDRPPEMPEVQVEKGEQGAEAIVPEAYAEWLKDRAGSMDLKDLIRDSSVIRVRLPEIFQPLYGNDPDDKGETREKEGMRENPKPLSIERIAARGETLLITGTAGSGKTTLAKYMAGAVVRNASQWFRKDLLPVLIYFKDLKWVDIEGIIANAGAAEDILAWYCQDKTSGMLDLETALAFCREGKCLVLLDGLDEADRAVRDFVVESFADFRHRFKGIQIVLSGRPHGAEGEAAKRFGHRRVRVHDLTEDQADAFIRNWFARVYPEGGMTGQETAEKMIGEIRARQDIDALKNNPLMLTAMCILYNDSKALPDQRADLYNRFVERLLGKFGPERNRVRQFLMELAADMFRAGERGMDRCDAVRLMKAYPSPGDEAACPDTDFDRIEPATGLLGLEDGRYKFLHLGFQEFLTARFLHDTLEGDPYDAVAPYVNDPRYHEVVALFIGFLSLSSAGNARAIIRRIFEQDPEEPEAGNWMLAARSLLDMHEATRNPDITGLAHDRMLTLIRKGAPPKILLHAGEALGRLGYRKGYKAFVRIEGGTYDLEELGEKTIPDFEISRFPVVNFWFAEFVRAGGYKDKSLWTDQGWEWLGEAGVTEPWSFRGPRLNCPTTPVIGVSWYEAKAFCNWLTASLADGFAYDLPTDVQWQAVAGGREQRKYPWGRETSPDRCNYEDTGLKKPSPVGVFSGGKTPEGIHDLGGNVWEWIRTAYTQKTNPDDFLYDRELSELFRNKEYEKYLEELRNENRVLPALRGGAFFSGTVYCRCAARYGLGPDDRGSFLGFRCARIRL